MFSKDVLRVLQVSRPTLTKYVKTGIIRGHVMPNGHYDYNEDDVYKFLNKDVKRKTLLVFLRQSRNLTSRTRSNCSSSSALQTATPSTAYSRTLPVASALRSERDCSTCWTMSLPGALSVWL